MERDHSASSLMARITIFLGHSYQQRVKVQSSASYTYTILRMRFRIALMQSTTLKRMVEISATKMISNKLKNQTSTEFPEEIRAITGKELRLKLLISEDNVKVNSRLFFAVDAVDADAPVSAICSVSGTSSTPSSITNSSAVKHLEETETPSTSKSSTKRVKVEL
nr:PREDICTED: uncharacterized protein LOC108198018 [Daucus carota subsp. sativus]